MSLSELTALKGKQNDLDRHLQVCRQKPKNLNKPIAATNRCHGFTQMAHATLRGILCIGLESLGCARRCARRYLRRSSWAECDEQW